MPTLALLWVWFCAYLNCAGWALSAVHQLNAGGYIVALAIWLLTLFIWKKKASAQLAPQVCWQKYFLRFRRPFPLAFLVLAAMAFLGGVIYAPTNYDALAYRVPRVLHWLAAEQWHWIHTIFDRVNNRSCGIEWVSAPFIAIFRTDRFLFLINTASFLFLPGLIFSVFTRLGVRRRVAWHWMWIVPTGYGFILQAGSIGNDLFGATFALAAIDFALRVKVSNSPRDFFASILAAAMMTSAKTSSLPLLLPWAIAILPSLKLISRRPLATFAVCGLAIFTSALPTMYLNQKFSNDWSGAGLDNGRAKPAAILKTGANSVLLAVENLAPPIFPMNNKWNSAVEKHLPPKLEEYLAQVIEYPGCKFSLGQMQMEENAGLGFGVSALLLASIFPAFILRNKNSPGKESAWLKCVRWSPAISLLAVLMESNITAIARALIPYYVLLIPILLVCAGHEQVVKKSWWRRVAFIVVFIAATLLIISPARPLFPAMTIFSKMQSVPVRVREVYSVYRNRNDAFAPARDILPRGLKILGLITFDDPETSLWHPFGSRQIIQICPQDTAVDLKARGVEYILVRNEAFGKWFGGSFDEWLKKMDAQVVRTISLDLRAAQGPMDWHLVKLN